MASEHPPTLRRRDRDIVRVLWIVLGLNLLVAAAKLVFGMLSGAVSMVADGIHSLLDASSNVVGILGMRVARKAPDAEHPYGHRKFEALAALGISLFLFLACYEVVTSVLARFEGEHRVEPRPATFAVVLVSMAVSQLVSRYESRRGKALRSLILTADAKHTQTDVLAGLGVLASLVAASLGFTLLDLIVAAGIAVVIAHAGYTIVMGSFSVLADAQAVDPQEVVRIATRVEGVEHAHRVRSRGHPDDIHIDLHVHVSPDLSVAAAHELGHEAAREIKKRMEGVTDVVVHLEPDVAGHEE